MHWDTFRRMSSAVSIFALIITMATVSNGLDVGRCRLAMGMQTHEIPDHAIKASSSLNHSNVGPASARVRTEINGGAWCPKEQVSENVYEFLQIDFSELKVITLVETQGRFGNGQGQEYVEQYTLEYQREIEGRWFQFFNRRGQKIFQGNTNTYIAELREVDPPIIARAIRFVPYSERPKSACLRVEVYGCPWKDGVVWYSMPQGERRSTEVEFRDSTYDGTVEENHLRGGLGQLTDGDKGHSNFRQDIKNSGIKGYGWIGWKNDSFTNGLVEIIFKFDVRRNFSSLTLHCNNLFAKNMRVFRSARVAFSRNEKFFPVPSVDYRSTRDSTTDVARSVEVPLNNAVGQYVRLELFFDSQWMLISEVQFDSEPVKEENQDDENEMITTSDVLFRAATDFTAFNSRIEVVDVVFEKKNDTVTKDSFIWNAVLKTTTKLHLLETSPLNDLHGEKVMNTSILEKKINDEYVGIIIGMLFVVAVILLAIILLMILRHRRQKYANGHQVIKCIEPRHVAVTMNSLRNSRATLSNGKINNGNIYDFVATSDIDSDPARSCCGGGITNMVEFYPEASERICQLSDLPRPPISSGTVGKECSIKNILDKPLTANLPSVTHNSSVKNSWTNFNGNSFSPELNPYQASFLPPFHSPKSTALHGLSHGTYECLSSISGATAHQDHLGNSNQALSVGLNAVGFNDFTAVEFPSETVKFIKKMADWQFGQVHLCEARLADTTWKTDSKLMSTVVVKMIQRPADEQTKLEFWKEIQMMSQLLDVNIVQLLGICSKSEPFLIIYEHLKYGDLKKFLLQHSADFSTGIPDASPILSYGTLIYMASQIASGMKHLEMINIVHRDLGTRNCQVGENYAVKVSDYGISRNVYREDYYVIDEKLLLPIRWMSWESLSLNKFSCKSDVWSFGITMWEILTLGREKPLSRMTDHQVLENHSHYYAGNGREECPTQPDGCPREIYDLMRECWNRDEGNRPTFREIHMFLQRKNMGYNPLQDAQRLHTVDLNLV